MARGLRREVRNDRPAVGETRQQMYERQRNEYLEAKMPSRNRPSRRRAVPPGCISVYRVHQFNGTKNDYFGVFRDEEEAYRVADAEWRRQGRRTSSRIWVEHKAAIELDGRYHIVNLDPIKFAEPTGSHSVLTGGTGVRHNYESTPASWPGPYDEQSVADPM